MNCKRDGFSRIEIIGVLGTTALLAGVLLPAAAQGGFFDVFGRARENARRSSCQSNLKQIGLGMAMYSIDYDEHFPPATSNSKNGYGWAELLQPYLSNTPIFQCPVELHGSSPDAKKSGYTDYWYNARFSRLNSAKVASPFQTLTMGDGDGGSPQSTARYNLKSLPASWSKFDLSPSKRHLAGANYAFADGHVKWLLPDNISALPLKQSGTNATFALR